MRNTTSSSHFALATEPRGPASLTPSIRLVSATPSAAGNSSDVNKSVSNSVETSWASVPPSVIAPKSDALPRKRLIPKKSKLGLLGPKGRGPSVTSDQIGADNPSAREGFEIFVDPTNDPEFSDVLVVKKQKSRGALNGMSWGALGEVTNVPNVPQNDIAPSGKEEDKKWWSIGRGRKDSRDKEIKENAKRSKSPEVVRSQTPEPFKGKQDTRIRFNSLDAGILLGKSGHMDAPPMKASTASDPEQLSSYTHRGRRSFTPDSLREACRAPSPVPPRSTTPASTLSGFLAPSKEQGSIALRAIRSVKSLARMGSLAQLGVSENGTRSGTVKEKKEKRDKKEKKERKENKENVEGTVLGKKERKEKKERRERRKERKEKAEKERKKDKEIVPTLRHSTSSFGPSTLTNLDHKSSAQTLGKKKLSILGMGLGLPSSMRLRSGSTASSILPQLGQTSAEGLGSQAKPRMGSTISTASSLRPRSTASSSGGSACTRESRGSVKWDEVCLVNGKKEIQKEKKEKRRKRKDEGKESKKSSGSKKRVAITDVFPEVASDQERDVKEELQKRYSSAFPISTIDEISTDDCRGSGGTSTFDPIFNGAISPHIEKLEEEDTPTPVKKHRPRPMSEQLLGKPRPRAVYEDDEGVISILDAATNDLALLINNLDLEATPTPVRPPPFPAGILDPIPSHVDFLSTKGPTASDSPLKNKTPPGGSKGLASRSNTASISSLRPYAQSRGKATRTLATPVFSEDCEATVRKKSTDLAIGQQIAPWPVLLQQLSPVKEQKIKSGDDKENVATRESPPKLGTWRKAHKRSSTPLPEPEPESGFVFQSLRPPKPRTSKILESEDGKATLRSSSGTFFGSSSVVSNLASIVKGPTSPSSSLGRRASAFLRKHWSLLPAPADVSGADASFACAGLSSDGTPPEIKSLIGKKRWSPPTLGGSDVSCYAVPELDVSDPDSDIPDELRCELRANSDRESDDDTFDFTRRFARGGVDEIEYPRSSFPLQSIPSEFRGTSAFRPSLTRAGGIAEEIDEGEHADGDSDPEADTKKSFDFTGELRRLNESGASDRHSFVEQLERAFKTPAKVDLRYGPDSLMSVEVPPVPRLPLDLDMRVKGVPSRVSLDFSKFGESDESKELSQGASEESEPEAFDIYEVSRLVDARELSRCKSKSKESQKTSRDMASGGPLSSPEDSMRSSLEGNSSVDSDDGPNRIIVSADPTESMSTFSFNVSRPSNGKLNESFKFGGLSVPRSSDSLKKREDQLTLSDIIPPLSRGRPLSSSSASLEDDSLFRSIFTPDNDDVPQSQSHLRPISNDKNQFLQVTNSLYRTSQASSVVSFTGFDAFEEVRRGFEFNSQRPNFYPPPAANNRRVDPSTRDSFLSIASISSYGRVINPGAPDPFDFGLPSLMERPSSENLSTRSFSIDDTFSFLKRDPRRKRVDSDASSFYFQSQASLGHQRNNSNKSVSSLAPPLSRPNRNLATHRNDSGASMASGSVWRKSWRASHRFNNSMDSIISDLASMQLGRPGLGDKMFETSDQAMPLTSIATSPTTASDIFSFSRQQSTHDSIMDDDGRVSDDGSDSLFENSGPQNPASSRDSLFGQDDDSRYLQGFPRPFRPMSIMSAATSVHSLPREDDTMITMLGGGHVRRRSLGSIMEGSPCARAEKRKQSALQQESKFFRSEYEPPNKARIIEQPSFGSPFHFQVEDTAQPGGKLGGTSFEDSCFVGSGEDSSISFRRLPVFTRPPLTSRSRSSTVTSSSGGDSPPLLTSDVSSISGSSISSIDLSDINALLSNTNTSLPTSTLSHARARVRARGHGHRRRYSHVRSSQVYSVYETIEEELSSASASPVHPVTDDKLSNPTQTQPVFIVEGDMTSIHSNTEDTVSLWDDERGITALRRYYALQDEAQSTVSDSKQTWTDTPFSIFAVQSFKPPHHPEGMKALLEQSIQTYGPLPSELRVRRCRSRKNSRPSPYPQTRPSKAAISPEVTQTLHQLPPAPSLAVNFPSVADSINSVSSSTSGTSDCQSSVLNTTNGTIRARARSTMKRSALGLTKKNMTKPKESAELSNLGIQKSNAGAPTASTEQKENVGMGNILTSGDTLRINRPRPKGRTTLASATMRALRSVQI